jgi:hypothetical protein
MKKFTIITSLLISALLSDVKGQSVINVQEDAKNHRVSIEALPNSPENIRRDAASRWFNFASSYASLNGLTYRNIVSVLFPDTAQIVFTDGIGRVQYMTFGANFSPNDFAFGNNRFNRWTNYTWDSIAWSQCYIRSVDSTNVTNQVAATGSVTVLDFTDLANVTFTIGSTTLTEGLEWDATDDNSTTAQSLATAINAISGAPYLTSVNDSTITITNAVAGTVGNSVALATSNPTSLELSGANLAGGGSQVVKVEVVDTLFVQLFTGESLDLRGLTFNDDPQTQYLTAYPRITGFTPSTLLNTTAFRTDTILLTAEWKDSLSITPLNMTTRRLVNNIGVSVTGGNDPMATVISSAFTYKPMLSYTISDTLISFVENVSISKKNNVMIFPYFNSTNHTHRISDYDAINNSYGTTGDLKGGAAGQGNFRSYRTLPGAIQNMSYHLSTQSTNVESLASGSSFRLGNAYPNPTSGSESFVIPFTMGTSGNATFTVSDITGKVIKSVSKDFNAGENQIAIETNGLNSGIYFYQMITGPFKGVGKIIIK